MNIWTNKQRKEDVLFIVIDKRYAKANAYNLKNTKKHKKYGKGLTRVDL